jgi:uncharacterized repeat protein (TIGR01451 family)
VGVTVGEIAGGDAAVTITFQVLIANPVAAGVDQITNQGVASSAEMPAVPTDDPDVGGAADPTITPVTAAPLLAVRKTDVLFSDADGDGLVSPGDELRYQISIENSGNTSATGVILTDATPLLTTLVAGTVQTSQGTIVSADPVEVDLGEIVPGSPAVVSFRIDIENPFPATHTSVQNQAVAQSAELPPVVSDDPRTPQPADPTVTPVFVPPEVAIADVTVAEGDVGATDAVFTLSLSVASGRQVSVDYATADDTALAGLDYQAAAGTVTFPPGTTSTTVAVPVLGDLSDEPDETFSVDLTSPVNATLADPEGLGTILDDDEMEISVDDVTIDEGDTGTVDALFTISLSSQSASPLSVDFATADGTATAGGDYQATSGTLTLAPGETSGTLAVTVFGDLQLEPDETFSVELSNPTAGVLADGLGLGTILDDEQCSGPELLVNPGAEQPLAGGELPGWTEVVGGDWQPRFAAPPPIEGQAYFFAGMVPLAELRQDVDISAYAAEVDSGGQLFSLQAFVRTRDEIPADSTHIVVEYRDATNSVLDAFDSGEITSPTAWQEVSDVRAVPAGTRWIGVRLLATNWGADDDNDGYFDGLSLRSLGTAVLIAGDVMVVEGDTGATPALFEIKLSCAVPVEVTVTAATADGTALAGEDYEAFGPATVTLPAGATGAPVPVTVNGDLQVEPDELFTLELSDPFGALLVDSQGLGLILNDDDDTDLDGVPDELDVCPDTWIPERVPTRELRPNRYALVDENTVFDTWQQGKRSPDQTRSFTVDDTAGCSCEQIIIGLELGKGHTKFGCSLGAMREWVGLVNP